MCDGTVAAEGGLAGAPSAPRLGARIRRVAQALGKRSPSTLRVSLRERFVAYFAVILACWSLWVALAWPGALRDDTLAQYLQSSGIHNYYTQHPLFDTLIFGLFWYLGDALGSPLTGLGLYTATQVTLLAAGCALALCYIRKLGAPRWPLGVGLLYLSTSYVVVGATTTMSKDSLHTVFFLPMAVIFVEAALTRGEVLRRTPVACWFTLLVFGSVASKRTALLIVLCSGVCLVLACRKGRKLRAAICIVAGIIVAQCVFAPLAASLTHANRSPSREVWGYITQPIAQIAHDNPSAISPSQRKTLNKIMNLDEAAANICATRTNETFQTLHTNPAPSSHEKLAALRVWAELGVRHPGEYWKAYAGPIRGWWDPRVNFSYPTDVDYLFSPGYLRQWATYLTAPQYSGDSKEAKERSLAAITRDLSPLMGTSNKPQWKKNVLDYVRTWVRADNPLTSMALYVTWIPLLTIVSLAVRAALRRRSGVGSAANRFETASGPVGSNGVGGGRRSMWPLFAAASLLVFTVLSLYASPEALFWYPIPVYFCLPLFTALPFAPAGDAIKRQPAK